MIFEKKPKISVICAIYGVEKFLKEAIDSVLNQTLDDIEIILIDDGSKDNCPKIIDEYKEKDNRIIAIHKENSGYGASMNLGLSKAKGEYIAILEPDDYIDKNMYFDLYKIAKKFNSDIVKSSFYTNIDTFLIKETVEMEWEYDFPLNKTFKITEHPEFLSTHPSIWSAIYKRSFLEKNNIKFIEEKGSGWVDNLFNVQTMCLADKINFTYSAYYHWRVQDFLNPPTKDYTIPYKRTLEIHKWLKENNIDDIGIIKNLYKREFIYLGQLLKNTDISDIDDFYKKTEEILNNMDIKIISLMTLNKGENELYKNKNNPKKIRRKMLLKRYFEKIFFKKNIGQYVVISCLGIIFKKKRRLQILRDKMYQMRKEILRLGSIIDCK